jgi:hypothetical protein
MQAFELKMTPPPDSNAPIERHFDYLQVHAKEYASFLNQEGLWLFLSVMACMGVPNICLRLTGAVLIVFLFSYRFFSSLIDKDSFSKIADKVKVKIEKDYEQGVIKESFLSKLSEIEKDSFGSKRIYERSLPFLFCAAYSLASLVWIIVSALELYLGLI